MFRFVMVIFFCGAVPAFASSPVLSNILPRGAQRGTETEVLFNGQRLEDAQELMIYEPGIEVTEFAVVNDKQVKAKLKIAADCTLGTKHFRIRAATGLSDLRTFRVGALPNVMEVEPNSDFKQPQAIATNVTVEGIIQNEDVDYFVIEAKKGDRITAEVEGIRLGDSMFDPYVAILNETRFELDTSDDAALVWQDGVASIIAPADGKYIIQLRESSYGGNGNCHYRCHIGSYPRPLAIVPSGGKPGQKVAVKFLGDISGEFTRDQISLCLRPTKKGFRHRVTASALSILRTRWSRSRMKTLRNPRRLPHRLHSTEFFLRRRMWITSVLRRQKDNPWKFTSGPDDCGQNSIQC